MYADTDGTLTLQSTRQAGTRTNNQTISIISEDFANQKVNDMDLALAASQASIFILRQQKGNAAPLSITGIAGGTDGRIITIKTDSDNFSITLGNENEGSLPQNRMKLGRDKSVNGYGSFQLVYVGADQRWHLLNQNKD